MKGTLFSSDFIIDENDNLRLLEFNTDTGFLSSTLDSKFDFTAFINILSTNNITKLWLIYKGFQSNMVEKLEEVIANDATFITQVTKIKEEVNCIYPTAVDDASDRFILRLCYDENALFDSGYARSRVEVLKLFHDNSQDSLIPEFYYSGSNYEANTMTSAINDSNIVPDIIEKDAAERHAPLAFFKFTDTSNTSSADNLTYYRDTYLAKSYRYLERYHTNPTQLSAGKVQSIREFGIVYGTDISYVRLGNYKIDGEYGLPSNISTYTTTGSAVRLPIKHYFEWTTNWMREASTDGMLGSEQLQKPDDSFKYPYNLIVSESLKSYYVSGSPDTDDSEIFYSWSHEGNQLGGGSKVTSSIVEKIESSSLSYGCCIELNLTGGENIYFSILKNVLVYDTGSNQFLFKPAGELNPASHSLVDENGDILAISESHVAIIDEPSSHSLYRVDVEDTDTYFVSASTPFVVHNAPCFVAGTMIEVEEKGQTNIEDVVVGDKVLTYNHDGDHNEYCEVKSTMVKENEKVVSYIFAKEEFKSNRIVKELTGTPDHPLFVCGKGYASYDPKRTKEDCGLDVEQIAIGDEVLHADGYGVRIVDIIEHEEPQTVYNLDSVDKNHNFFAWSFLAHNRLPPTCFAAGTQISLSNGDVKNIEDIVVGDVVLGWDGEKLDSAEVIATDNTHTVESHAAVCERLGDEPSLYTIDDIGIEFTPEHPFLTKDGWKSLVPDSNQEPYKSMYGVDLTNHILKDGDQVNVSGEWKTIKEIKVARSNPKETVYNITVDRLHSYIANGIIVHNK